MRSIFAVFAMALVVHATARADVVELAELAQKKVEDSSLASAKKRLAELEIERTHLYGLTRAIHGLMDLLPASTAEPKFEKVRGLCLSTELTRNRQTGTGFFDDINFEADQLGDKSRRYTIDRFKTAKHPNTIKGIFSDEPDYRNALSSLYDECDSFLKGGKSSFEPIARNSQILRDLLTELDINAGHLTARYLELFNRVAKESVAQPLVPSANVINDATPLASVAYTFSFENLYSRPEGDVVRIFGGKTVDCRLGIDSRKVAEAQLLLPMKAAYTTVQAAGPPRGNYEDCLSFSPLSREMVWESLNCCFHATKPVETVGDLKAVFGAEFGDRAALWFNPLAPARTYCDEPNLTWISDGFSMPQMGKKYYDEPNSVHYPKFLIRKNLDSPAGTTIFLVDGKQSEFAPTDPHSLWTGCVLEPVDSTKALHLKVGTLLEVESAALESHVKERTWSSDEQYKTLSLVFKSGQLKSATCRQAKESNLSSGDIRRQFGYDLLGIVGTETKPECLAMNSATKGNEALALLTAPNSASSPRIEEGDLKTAALFESSSKQKASNPSGKIGI